MEINKLKIQYLPHPHPQPSQQNICPIAMELHHSHLKTKVYKRKDWPTDTYWNMHEPWQHHEKWKKPVTKKDNHCTILFTWMPRIGKSTQKESTVDYVIANGCAEIGRLAFFLRQWKYYKMDWDDGCTTLWVNQNTWNCCIL